MERGHTSLRNTSTGSLIESNLMCGHKIGLTILRVMSERSMQLVTVRAANQAILLAPQLVLGI